MTTNNYNLVLEIIESYEDQEILNDFKKEFKPGQNISKKEYYYHMALEHVNSAQNLINIIKYNFPNYSDQFLPFRIRSINLNLMYNIIIYK